MIVQTIIFAVLLLIMWTIVILLVWHDANQPKIVRCKDCKHFESEEDDPYYGPYCKWHCSNCSYNDFCSYGERKTNNDGTR